MFHAPIVSTMIVNSGVQSLIHWILGVWWRRLQGENWGFSFFSLSLPHACYACLVLSELAVKSERLICFNIKEIKGNWLVSWRLREPPEESKLQKTENVWYCTSAPQNSFCEAHYCTMTVRKMPSVISSFNFSDLVWFWLMFTQTDSGEDCAFLWKTTNNTLKAAEHMHIH